MIIFFNTTLVQHNIEYCIHMLWKDCDWVTLHRATWLNNNYYVKQSECPPCNVCLVAQYSHFHICPLQINDYFMTYIYVIERSGLRVTIFHAVCIEQDSDARFTQWLYDVFTLPLQTGRDIWKNSFQTFNFIWIQYLDLTLTSQPHSLHV